MIERAPGQLSASLERAFRNQFTPGWVSAEISAALAQDNAPRALWLADLAEEEGLSLPAPTLAEIERLRAETTGFSAQASSCAACMVDAATCPDLSSIAICNVPFELTPFGDLNALWRQSWAAKNGETVDKFETGLALVGLAATASALFTAGSSLPLKAGATGLRVAKRLGALTPGLRRLIGDLTDLPIDGGAILRGAPIAEITDAAKLSRLTSLLTDLGRVAENTSVSEAVVLLRHVDGAEDAARLARLSDAAKTRTYSRMEVLGKSRSFRAMMRVSNLTLSALAAIYAGLLGLLTSVAGWIGGRILRRALR